MSQSATPATHNHMTTCLDTFEYEMFSSFPHRHGDATGKPETRDKTRGCRKTSILCDICSNFDIFDTLSKQVGMSQSAMPATQNDMTTCLETFEKERFCSFPHRHGDATGKPATRGETRGCRKTSISCETSSRARLLPIFTFSTRYQTGWIVTKCHACHAKRHDNLLGNLREGDVLQLPP